jgi:hypothetical protein
MRSYLIDELESSDLARVREFLSDHATPSELGDIFWIPIPDDLLNESQYQHRQCRPHVLAVELGDTWVRMECFVRSLRGMRCECQAYCTPQQMLLLLNFAHAMLDELGIRT